MSDAVLGWAAGGETLRKSGLQSKMRRISSLAALPKVAALGSMSSLRAKVRAPRALALPTWGPLAPAAQSLGSARTAAPGHRLTSPSRAHSV